VETALNGSVSESVRWSGF